MYQAVRDPLSNLHFNACLSSIITSGTAWLNFTDAPQLSLSISLPTPLSSHTHKHSLSFSHSGRSFPTVTFFLSWLRWLSLCLSPPPPGTFTTPLHFSTAYSVPVVGMLCGSLLCIFFSFYFSSRAVLYRLLCKVIESDTASF